MKASMNASMKRALYTLGAPLLLLGGCRGVVGIHDLDVVADGGSSSGSDAASDSAMGTDAAGKDAASDAPVHVPVDAGCASSTGMACGKCCRMAAVLMPAFAKLDVLAKDHGCVCGSGACSAPTDCGGTVCIGAPSAASCGGCVDMSLHPMPPAVASTACMESEGACRGDAVCNDALLCQKSCNP